MTEETAVSALVLDTIAYRDKDFVVRLLTADEGVISAMAFGARGSRTSTLRGQAGEEVG